MNTIRKLPSSFLKENNVLYVLLLLMVALFGFRVYQDRAVLNPFGSTEFEEISVGAQIPSITLQTLEGSTYDLNSSNDEKLLIFFHTDCPFCAADRQLWQTLYERSLDEGIEVVAVTSETDSKVVAEYAQENNIPFPVMLDSGGKLFSAASIQVTPTKVLISNEGVILQTWRGWTTQQSAEAELGSMFTLFDIHPSQLPSSVGADARSTPLPSSES